MLSTLRTGRPGLRLALSALAFSLVLGACGGDDEDDGDDELEGGGVSTQTVSVDAYDFYFEETSLLLESGTTVEVDFENLGEVAHSFTIPDLDVDVDADAGDTTTVTFNTPEEPGSLDFYCKYHPDEMEGTISIGGGDDPLDEDSEGVDTETEESPVDDGDPATNDEGVVEQDPGY